MKTYYQALTTLTLSGFLFITSCSKDFLEVDPKATQIETNYYRNPTEAFNGLVAAYDPVGWEGGLGGNYANFACFVSASDECLGGGGSASDLPYLNSMDTYNLDAATGPQLSFWQKGFTGVSRVNTILDKLSGEIPGLSAGLQARYIAEAKILRAYYYFDLVRLFGSVPLFTEPLSTDEIYTVSQAGVTEVYQQIEKDLTEAIAETNLPDKIVAATEGGRFTKGVAHGLLGKVLLYEKKWADAAKQFAEINGTPGSVNRFGYALLPKFSDIFRPDNKFNAEAILEITHTSSAASNWGNTSRVEGFIASTMFGPRSYNGPLYYSGWGGCPVALSLFNALRNDPRYDATISNIDSMAKAGRATYVPGHQNTGLFVKKFAPLTAFRNTGAGPHTINYPQNYIEMRLADTYLMEAEALLQSQANIARAGILLNAVRSRVGLTPVTASLENIYNERYLELAAEGHRWQDLIRTGRAAAVLGPLGFQANKHELLPIPLPELNNTKMVQNKGY